MTTATRIRKNQEAKTRYYSLCYAISAEEYETAQFVHSTFKKDDQFYMVARTDTNPGTLRNYVTQRGMATDYRILETLGKTTKLNKGVWLAPVASEPTAEAAPTHRFPVGANVAFKIIQREITGHVIERFVTYGDPVYRVITGNGNIIRLSEDKLSAL